MDNGTYVCSVSAKCNSVYTSCYTVPITNGNELYLFPFNASAITCVHTSSGP